VCTSLFTDGAPKKEVKEPCLSFFGADGEVTAAERDDVAFRLAFILLTKAVVRATR